MSFASLRDKSLIFLPALLLIGGEGGAYYAYGQQYADILARSGITLKVQPTAGSLENIKLLRDDEAGVALGLMQGGISNKELTPSITSLGRIFIEPLWVFSRAGTRLEVLTDLKGKRVAIGGQNSGTAHLASQLLLANKLTQGAVDVAYIAGQRAIDALLAGEVDAVFLVLAPKSEMIRSLLRNPAIALMNFKRAEAYTRNFPYLNKLILPQGAVDMAANIPPADIALVGTSAALVARDDFHPALAGLMVEALKEVHRDGDMFQRIGEFPQVIDPEYEVTADTERSYKDGVPFLQRYLPFWLASFLQRKFLLILPIATVLFPVVKLAPMLYNWRVRNRILYWYGELKKLEASINNDPANEHLAGHMAELERIDSSVQAITVPNDYSDQFYHLRRAVRLVRGRLEAAG